MSETSYVNAHTHLYSALAALGMPAPREAPTTFLEILERVWWRLDRALDAESLRAGARLYVAEALLAGTATLIDHHESPNFIEGSLDVLADVCDELGVRALLCYGATERNGGREEARRGLAECARFIRENKRPRVRGAIALHACFTCSDDTIREAGDLARSLGSVLHVHVAEDGADVRDAKERGYEGVVDRMAKLGAIVAGSIFAHGVHLSPEEVRFVTEAGCFLVQNPRSNKGNRVGYPSALSRSSRVALGTDGYPADMLAEREALYVEAQAHGDDMARVEARLPAGAELAAALFGDTDEVRVACSRERLSVGGRLLVEQGRLLGSDLEAIRAHAREQAPPLFERMAAL